MNFEQPGAVLCLFVLVSRKYKKYLKIISIYISCWCFECLQYWSSNYLCQWIHFLCFILHRSCSYLYLLCRVWILFSTCWMPYWCFLWCFYKCLQQLDVILAECSQCNSSTTISSTSSSQCDTSQIITCVDEYNSCSSSSTDLAVICTCWEEYGSCLALAGCLTTGASCNAFTSACETAGCDFNVLNVLYPQPPLVLLPQLHLPHVVLK